ncbi:ROK family protein [Deinococcus cellulosilyticus]|uniref:Glucokinase n=1 Tax=Deinococcus cellulosilyticus (strain DSM 18568 / NBRC 106333 / KACC 11606 / 5516J-15) TaxID=1223518 RepID=A0A511MZK2_DEIC1|nr:ROK family protein [Deinococcus cellulosilyticus]GEM45741.1 glucokinase [Deinococcus cellulosilyticus NBRC 106333 = KACC 11606]
MSLIGVDLGGTKIAVAVVQEGSITHKSVEPTPKDGWVSVLDQIARQVEELRQHVPDLETVGVGLPGPLDFKQGMVKFAPNIYGFENVPVRSYLAEKLNMHVDIENDANAAALGEGVYGAGRGTDSSVFITISTGIGGGIVLNGRVIRGAHGVGGEIGHVTALPYGTVAGSGVVGGLEALCSGTAIARDASFALNKPTTTAEAFQLAQDGHPIAKRVVETAMTHIGTLVANLQLTIDPEVFVLGGGVSSVGDYFINFVRDVAIDRLGNFDVRPEIRLAALGTDAGVIGAALAGRKF